jgi:very-short-patch-repair endonuclease
MKQAHSIPILPCSPLEGEPNPSSDLVGGYHTILTHYARMMRKEPTPWEKKLWVRLKGAQLGGFKFRRQQTIGAYIADFYNAEKRIIIELDGSQHADSTTDKARDEILAKLGYRVVRVWNSDVENNIEGVLTSLLHALHDTPHRNAPRGVSTPPQGGSREPNSRITSHPSPLTAS